LALVERAAPQSLLIILMAILAEMALLILFLVLGLEQLPELWALAEIAPGRQLLVLPELEVVLAAMVELPLQQVEQGPLELPQQMRELGVDLAVALLQETLHLLVLPVVPFLELPQRAKELPVL
jgi:hypothetical protein